MVAPLSEVPQEGSSVFSLFSLIKLNLASHPLAISSYSRVTVSSVFCAQNICFRDLVKEYKMKVHICSENMEYGVSYLVQELFELWYEFGRVHGATLLQCSVREELSRIRLLHLITP